MSKIQFESKSQQNVLHCKSRWRWISVCQRYNLKANHNRSLHRDEKPKGEYQYVKDTIWKQITTDDLIVISFEKVNISMSKIQFESKSQQKRAFHSSIFWWISVCQRYNLKANHNLYVLFVQGGGGEYQYVKDTIWKQITTPKRPG